MARGEFDLTVDNANFSGANLDEGIFFDLGANHIGRTDFTLTNSTIVSINSSALAATLDAGTGDVRFLMQNNDNLAGTVAAGQGAVDVHVGSNVTLNATIGNTVTSDVLDPVAVPDSIGDFNLFTSTGAGDPFRMEVNDAAGTINLDLRDNTAAGGTVAYELIQTSGAFNLVDGGDTLNGDNNVGTVNDTGVITPIAPPVSTPTP